MNLYVVLYVGSEYEGGDTIIGIFDEEHIARHVASLHADKGAETDVEAYPLNVDIFNDTLYS